MYNDFIGKKFGSLTIKSISLKKSGVKNQAYAHCECSCGASGYTFLSGLKNGRSSSCKKYHNKSVHLENGTTEVYFHNGEMMLIDTSDYLLFDSRSFAYCKNPGYVMINLNGKQIYLHRFLAGIIYGESLNIADHKNRNPLDNRRKNIRNVSRSVNSHNQGSSKKSKSKYKGVSKHHQKFVSRIGLNGKYIHLGTFDNEKDAAIAYDFKAVEIYGDFATTNKVLGLL